VSRYTLQTSFNKQEVHKRSVLQTSSICFRLVQNGKKGDKNPKSYDISEAETKEKHGVWEPVPELTIIPHLMSTTESTTTH
jgi:hypothetical protein